MPHSEQESIIRCQKGDLSAFTDLYDLYVRQIFAFIMTRTRHRETAEDLTSVVFMKALEHISSYQHKASFSAWLYTIARNTIIDHVRRHKHADTIDDYLDLASSINVEADTDRALALQELQKRMSLLSPRQREIVTMRVWDQLSHKEIAEIIGLTETNAKVLFSRAVEKLGSTSIIALLLILSGIIN